MRRPADWTLTTSERWANNPPGVRLVLNTQDGRVAYRQNELIRLELAFSSEALERFRLHAAAYDRSGRLHMERFHFEPRAGLVDPLWDYFASSGPMGGISGRPWLSGQPETIRLDLNEWVRFDRPGIYRFFVTSYRIVDTSAPSATPSAVVFLQRADAHDRAERCGG